MTKPSAFNKSLRIGIITVRDAGYHPNRRLLEAARETGNAGILIHPYRLWPMTTGSRSKITGKKFHRQPHVILPRQGAQVGDTCLALLRQFQSKGIPLVNDVTAITRARNKFFTQQVLTGAGLPCIDTVFINAEAGFSHAVDRLGGYPVVTKQVSGRQGEGVLLIRNRHDAHRRALPTLDRYHGMMVQRYLPPEGRRDIRALVIGGHVACAAKLSPAEKEFRANFHLGSKIRATALAADLENIAVRAAGAIGCGVAGVDMLIDDRGCPFIVEVNYSPGFKGLEAATGLDIAGRIIGFAVDRYFERSQNSACDCPICI